MRTQKPDIQPDRSVGVHGQNFGGNGQLDRREPHQVQALLSRGGKEPRGAAALLRLAVLYRRGGQQLLCEPSAANAEKWAERTPEDFVFNIKAFRLSTGHQTPQASLPKDIQGELALHFVEKKNLYYKDTPAEIRDEMWRRYELGIRPLKEAGKLGAVHFQFPHWVRLAKGTTFVTLEDEKGNVKIIVWPTLGERQRKELVGSRLMVVDRRRDCVDGGQPHR